MAVEVKSEEAEAYEKKKKAYERTPFLVVGEGFSAVFPTEEKAREHLAYIERKLRGNEISGRVSGENLANIREALGQLRVRHWTELEVRPIPDTIRFLEGGVIVERSFNSVSRNGRMSDNNKE